MLSTLYVIPAKAGIHCLVFRGFIAALREWIPASAGMTVVLRGKVA